METKIFWLWMQSALGYGSGKVHDVLNRFGTAWEFYQAGSKEWRLSGLFSSKEIDKLENASLDEARKTQRRCDELGQWILTLDDKEYPPDLKNICNPPCILYGKGQLPDFQNRLAIAVVGTRSATPYGNTTAFDLGFGLGKAGAIVVSGGALGIDASSHKGALQAAGSTVAVLGGGINSNYLLENAPLRFEISRTGALISEFPPDTSVARWSFPMRNRIISGLAKGTVVVEAGTKSGSLITANLALEQGRDVFAVPGNVDSYVSNGTNRLIKSGAKAVTCLGDILEEYGLQVIPEESRQAPLLRQSSTPKRESEKTALRPGAKVSLRSDAPALQGLSENGKSLYQSLTDSPRHIDDLSKSAGLSIREALQAMTELELEDLVLSLSGRRYARRY